MDAVVNPTITIIQKLAEPIARYPPTCSFRRVFLDNGESLGLGVVAGMRIKKDLDSPNGALGYAAFSFGKGTEIINAPIGNSVSVREWVDLRLKQEKFSRRIGIR